MLSKVQLNLLSDNVFDFFNIEDHGKIEAELFQFMASHPKASMSTIINYALNTADFNDNEKAYALFFLGGVQEMMNKLKGV